MNYSLSDVARKFGINSSLVPYGNGHINDTYITVDEPKCILQRINTSIFKHPQEVMSNIISVTAYLRERILDAGGDPGRETLTVILTEDGESLCSTDNGDCFRAYRYVDDSITYETAVSSEVFYQSARAFGRFQNMLDGYPADKLFDTIPQFHDTRKRFRDFEEAVHADIAGRVATVTSEIDFVLARKSDTGVILDAMAAGEVPLRVTHNDTKLNNVLFDKETGNGLCVIDLDTVMPGSLLYDYGDALRFGASSGAEDEVDLDKIYFDLDLFEVYTKGFLEEVGGKLTAREIELLPFSAKLLTYECGMRFLGDYLNGDTYFKIHREHHNLDRARTQFKLVTDMEDKMEAMAAIVRRCI